MPATATPSRSTVRVHRIEVRPRRGQSDPRGAAVLRQVESLGLVLVIGVLLVAVSQHVDGASGVGKVIARAFGNAIRHVVAT